MASLQHPRTIVGYLGRTADGQLVTRTGRFTTDPHNVNQHGDRAQIAALIEREHADPKGRRFAGLVACFSDRTTEDIPLPADRAPAPSMAPAEAAPADEGEAMAAAPEAAPVSASAEPVPTCHAIKPDLSEAHRLLHAGMHLVKLIDHTKKPEGDGWNAPARLVKAIDPSATGYGLPLEPNGLCSVDPDNWPLAVRGMRAIGFDLEAIMAAGVRTRSTRTGSGGRATFAAEPELAWIKFSSRDKKVGTVLELRAGSPNLQDAVPGVVYHSKDGEVCNQAYANAHRLDDAPALPDGLMQFWQRCSTDIVFLNEQQSIFMEAVGAAPIQSISTGRKGGKLAYDAPGYRTEFNPAHNVVEIFTQHGYGFDQKSQRWYPPTATGAPSVREIPGKDGLWQSDHASDPLCGTFDAWTANVVLNHHGDVEAAKQSWDAECGLDQIDISEILKQAALRPIPPQTADQGAGNASAPANPFASFPEPVDVYARHPVRPYPLACIPAALSAYAEEQSRSTGFDVGGIAFILVAGLAALIDTRGRIKASPTWGEPPMMFSCLTDDSGSGKSYMLNAGTRPLRRIADELVRTSAQNKAKWLEQYNEWESQGKNGRGPRPEKPSWLQLVINDATVEAIADVMQTNKRGGVVQVDELTGLIGSMDAYSAGGGASASKDRAVYLRLYDGGPQVINRKTSGNQVIPNMAVSIITTVQPDPLGDMYRRGGSGGADGMFQRFLTYRPQPAGQVNLRAETSAFVAVAVDLIADQINRWTLEDRFLEVQPSLDEAATTAFQDDCNAISAMAAGYDQPRLREHLGKYKGFLLRMCFALHVIECASTPGEPRPEGGNHPPRLRPVVTADTLSRARGIIECLLNHSISLYEVIERDSPVTKLVRQVCDVILAKRWHTFTWGELTRDVSTWNGCKDEWIKEGALDRLVAFGWIRDDTVPPPPGSRGRKSKGMFTVNPAVHKTFADQAARKSAERARRRDAFDPITGKLRPKG